MIKQIFIVALALGAGSALAQQKGDKPAAKATAEKPAAAAAASEGQGLKNAVAMCIGCHGIPGYKTAYPDVYHVPKIAGQQPGYIVSALKAYKSGERSHPSMRGIAATLSEKDMTELANYYGGGK